MGKNIYSIGVVKIFNSNFGYIQVLNGKDVFFHKCNLVDHVKIFDVVAFKKRESVIKTGTIEAYEINLVVNIFPELEKTINLLEDSSFDEFIQLRRKGEVFEDVEIDLITRAVPSLYGKRLKLKYNGKDELLININEHIHKIDIDAILENYSVELTSGGRWKPGDDDSAWVHIESMGIPEPHDKDDYIKKFLFIREVVYHERSYTAYNQMLIEYKKDIKNWESLLEKARTIENENRIRFRKKYNSEEHKIELAKQINSELEKLKHNFDKDLNWYTDARFFKLVKEANDKSK